MYESEPEPEGYLLPPPRSEHATETDWRNWERMEEELRDRIRFEAVEDLLSDYLSPIQRAALELSQAPIPALDDLRDWAHGWWDVDSLEREETLLEQTLAELRAASNAALRSAEVQQAIYGAVPYRTRSELLRAWRRELLRQAAESPSERVLVALALAGSPLALAAAERAALAGNMLAAEVLAYLAELQSLGKEVHRLARRVAVLLAAVVLAPDLYLWRHTPPRDLLRGSQESHAPPANRAALTLRALASVVGDPSRTSPP